MLSLPALSCRLEAPVDPVTNTAPEGQRKDANARTYRLYSDDTATNALRVERFVGQIRIADLEPVFGELKRLRKDSDGNYIGGPLWKGGALWSLVASPSLEAVNVVTVDAAGTVSSAVDVDGDRIAEVVDTRPGEGGRFTIVTEELGLALFEAWLNGRNPLCDERGLANMAVPLFGCNDQAGGGGTGTIGSSHPELFGDICAGYEDGANGPRPGTFTHGGHGDGSALGRQRIRYNNLPGQRNIVETWSVYRDADGNHQATNREIEYFQGGARVRTVNENVDADGNGTRVVIDYDADGNPKSIRKTTFETEVGEDGTFTDENGSERPGDNPEAPEDWPSQSEDPGPVGVEDPQGAMAQWCAEHRPYVSGVERAAAEDPSAFQVTCRDIARADGEQCVIAEWAGSESFVGVVEPPDAGSNCGRFEQPGEDGTCGPSTGIERLRGQTAWIGSIELPEVEICNPLVCSPAP